MSGPLQEATEDKALRRMVYVLAMHALQSEGYVVADDELKAAVDWALHVGGAVKPRRTR